MRLSAKGEVYVIEANPNPWLSNKQEFAMAAKASGRTYTQLIGEIVELAMARYAARNKTSRGGTKKFRRITVYEALHAFTEALRRGWIYPASHPQESTTSCSSVFTEGIRCLRQQQSYSLTFFLFTVFGGAQEKSPGHKYQRDWEISAQHLKGTTSYKLQATHLEGWEPTASNSMH